MPPHVDVAKFSLPIKLFLYEWSGWASPFFAKNVQDHISQNLASNENPKKKNIKKNGH
jgi:hypothetical protein